MKVVNAFFLILVSALVLFSQENSTNENQGPLRIGLLHFSRSVSSKLEERIRNWEWYNNIEGKIQTRFQIDDRYNKEEEMSYEEMEAPENTIDDTMSSETMEKLKGYCGDLDGLIFGHFDKTSEKMTIVFRYYSRQLANEEGISIPVRSLYKEINLRELRPTTLRQTIEQLMDRLDAVIQGTEIVKKIPTPTPQHTPIQTVREEPLTIKDVYKKIEVRGFYCQSNPISSHRNIDIIANLIVSSSNLRKIDDINIVIFDSKRKITAAPLGTDADIIKTTSIHDNNPKDAITRLWAIRKIQKFRFKNAQTFIDQLNRIKYKGHDDWRIPTIKELLSIIEPDLHHNFFPSQLGLEDFFFVDEEDRKINKLSLWTSTPLKVPASENRKKLTRCPENVYFIIRNTRETTNKDNNWIGFDISCETWSQYIIPVSSTVHASATSSTQTPPVSPPRVEPQPSQTKHYLYVNHLPFIHSVTSTSPYVNKYADLVSQALLANVENKILKVDKMPGVNKPSHMIPSNYLDQFWSIIRTPATDEYKIDRISKKFMEPYNIDVIITGMFNDNIGVENRVIVWPVVIFKGHKKMTKGDLDLTERDIITTKKYQEDQKHVLSQDALEEIDQMFKAAFSDWSPKVAKIKGQRQDKIREQPVIEEHDTSSSTGGEGSESKPSGSSITSTPALPSVYAAQLDFLDASPKPVRGNRKEELELISDLMAEEINRQLTEIQKKDWNKQLIVNQPGYSVPNTTDNIEKVIDITFDQFMPQENRINKIVEKIMNPYNIDIIITGQFTYNRGKSEFIIRPIVILKSKILTENFYFDRAKLVYVSGTFHKVKLKRGAKKIIDDTVKGLIEKIGKQKKK